MLCSPSLLMSADGHPAFLNVFKGVHILSCGENVRTPHGIARVWPSPGKEPLEEVTGRVLIAVHLQATVRLFTVIGALPQGHGHQIATGAAHLGSITFAAMILSFSASSLRTRNVVYVFLCMYILYHLHMSLSRGKEMCSSYTRFTTWGSFSITVDDLPVQTIGL